jgi:hypothetical protein
MDRRDKKVSDANREWLFLDPPNTAVFTSVHILNEGDWVHYVTHDEEDGAWQFHPSHGPSNMKEAAVVSLRSMVDLDPRIEELADLPLGWHALARQRGRTLGAGTQGFELDHAQSPAL